MFDALTRRGGLFGGQWREHQKSLALAATPFAGPVLFARGLIDLVDRKGRGAAPVASAKRPPLPPAATPRAAMQGIDPRRPLERPVEFRGQQIPLMTPQERLEAAMRDPRAGDTLGPPRLNNRQRLAAAIQGESKPSSIRGYLAERITGEGNLDPGLLDFTPASWSFIDEAAGSLKRGDWESALWQVDGQALGSIPGLPFLRGAKGATRLIRRPAEGFPPSDSH